MNLELKHIKPYLDHQLNWDISNTEYGQIERARLKECKLEGIIFRDDPPILILKTNILTQNNGQLMLNTGAGKPIFRPLSDLNKENQTEESPDIEYEMIGHDLAREWCEVYEMWIDSLVDNFFDHKSAMQAPYEIFEWLVRNHYDVFGLIDKGLAKPM